MAIDPKGCSSRKMLEECGARVFVVKEDLDSRIYGELGVDSQRL